MLTAVSGDTRIARLQRGRKHDWRQTRICLLFRIYQVRRTLSAISILTSAFASSCCLSESVEVTFYFSASPCCVCESCPLFTLFFIIRPCSELSLHFFHTCETRNLTKVARVRIRFPRMLDFFLLHVEFGRNLILHECCRLAEAEPGTVPFIAS